MSTSIPLLTLVAVILMMLVELQLSWYNERVLRGRGAVEPPGDVYRVMQILYPLLFVAMCVEGALTGPASPATLGTGLILFGVAKALKFSAILALGVRWTFRVLVLPDTPLVSHGPYRFLRHPNYLAVLGEILGVALTVHAPLTGVASFLVFGWLMVKRIAVEEHALGLR